MTALGLPYVRPRNAGRRGGVEIRPMRVHHSIQKLIDRPMYRKLMAAQVRQANAPSRARRSGTALIVTSTK